MTDVTQHPALAVADSLGHASDVCRTWCEQVGGPAADAWRYWAGTRPGETALAAQRWRDVQQHLPVELLHPATQRHYLVVARRGTGWELESVHVSRERAAAREVVAAPYPGGRRLESVVLEWSPAGQTYALVEGASKWAV